ncbi:MAG: efflux RND transporter permease subunit, partial [Winogradskyella sp.]|uniref:efflux RND transporter permease subunit n=1 Tax=Winogradskyella sp. TaxID=1883156 RepID=UPI0025DBA0E3
LVYLNGKRSVVLAIIKQADARVYDLKEALQNLNTAFKEDYPNLEFSTNQDQTTLLKLSIDNLKSSLWIGSVLAILIMFFFLKDVKSPLIIAISIPVSLIISLLLMYAFGLSINIISLSGLILGVGMMIDNAIIVIDNITQKLESGLNLLEACVEGTNEIITPLISSVLTTCSVFLPLLFLSGITGALFYDQALAVSIGLGSSLVVSIVLIPVIYKLLKNKSFRFEKWLKFNAKTQHIEHWYEKGYNYFFGKKWIVYSISIVSIIVAVVLFQIMNYTQLPEINQNEIIANIEWNENINIKENQTRIQYFLKDISGIEVQFSQTGEQQFLLQRENTKSFSEASVYIKAENSKTLDDIKTKLQSAISKIYPSCNLKFSAPKTIFEYIFGTNKSKLVANVTSKTALEVPSEEKLNEISKLLEKKTSSEVPLQQTASIQIIHENVLLYNVNYDALVNELKTAFNENFVDNLKTAQKFIPIKLNYETKSFENIISGLFVRNENDVNIPVKNLIKINNIQQYKTINANRNGEYLGYTINTGNNVDNDINTIKTFFKSSEHFNVNFSGSWLAL